MCLIVQVYIRYCYQLSGMLTEKPIIKYDTTFETNSARLYSVYLVVFGLAEASDERVRMSETIVYFSFVFKQRFRVKITDVRRSFSLLFRYSGFQAQCDTGVKKPRAADSCFVVCTHSCAPVVNCCFLTIARNTLRYTRKT